MSLMHVLIHVLMHVPYACSLCMSLMHAPCQVQLLSDDIGTWVPWLVGRCGERASLLRPRRQRDDATLSNPPACPLFDCGSPGGARASASDSSSLHLSTSSSLHLSTSSLTPPACAHSTGCGTAYVRSRDFLAQAPVAPHRVCCTAGRCYPAHRHGRQAPRCSESGRRHMSEIVV